MLCIGFLQAGSNVPGNLPAVQALVNHSAFKITNPNNCYSLFLAFLRSPVNFHAANGSGYKFLADSILQVGEILAVLNNHNCLFMSFDCIQTRLYTNKLRLVLKQKLMGCSVGSIQPLLSHGIKNQPLSQ